MQRVTKCWTNISCYFPQRFKGLSRIYLYLNAHISVSMYIHCPGSTTSPRPSREQQKVPTSQCHLTGDTCLVTPWLLTQTHLFILERISPSSGVPPETDNQDQNPCFFGISSLSKQGRVAIFMRLLTPRLFLGDVPPRDQEWAYHGLTLFRDSKALSDTMSAVTA